MFGSESTRRQVLENRQLLLLEMLRRRSQIWGVPVREPWDVRRAPLRLTLSLGTVQISGWTKRRV